MTKAIQVFIFCLLISYNGICQKLEVQNTIYKQNVKTVRLYSDNRYSNSFSELPIIDLNQGNTLILDFDILNEDYEDYNIKIAHCNADWTISNLASLEYLSEYNEFNIQDYEYSFNTKVEYTNYRFKVPKLKRSGNYAIFAFKASEPKKPIFTKRFLAIKKLAEINAGLLQSNFVKYRNQKQRLKIRVEYPKLNILNPNKQLKVRIYQNHKLVSEGNNIQSTKTFLNSNTLIYDQFTGENEFWGGNEYRIFDVRSSNFGGQHIRDLKIDRRINTAFLYSDTPNNSRFYSKSMDDLNGKYKIENIDNPGEAGSEDYFNVVFNLKKEFYSNQELYIVGAFSDWKLKPEFKLIYQEESKSYVCSTLLKQGVYNYKYVIKGEKHNSIEGDHFETENLYEILLYYRAQNEIADEIIGYTKLKQ